MRVEKPKTNGVWWGEFTIPRDTSCRWRLGPLSLWVQHFEGEWRMAYAEDASGTAAEIEVNRPSSGPVDTAIVERFVAARPGKRFIVNPGLADRSIVVRPETSLRLAPAGVVDLFVSTAVWLRLETAEPHHLLLDIPTRRPSDIWFGPSTTEGELCYAGRTSARLHRENLQLSPHHAVTRVRLTNRAPDSLLLERLNLPVPNLALFADPDGGLWTQSVSIEREADGKMAKIGINEGPPAEVEGAEKLSEARRLRSRDIFSRALGAFLG